MDREEPVVDECEDKGKQKSEIDQLCQLIDQNAVVERVQG